MGAGAEAPDVGIAAAVAAGPAAEEADAAAEELASEALAGAAPPDGRGCDSARDMHCCQPEAR